MKLRPLGFLLALNVAVASAAQPYSAVFGDEKMWESPYGWLLDVLAPYTVPILVLAILGRFAIWRAVRRWKRKGESLKAKS